MRKKRNLFLSYILFAATLVLLGAVSARAQLSSAPPYAPGRLAGSAAGFGIEAPSIKPAERLCDSRHWIARRAHRPPPPSPRPPHKPLCPSVAGFEGRPLFELEVRAKIPDQPFYCRYDWRASEYRRSQPPSLATAAKIFSSVTGLKGPVPTCQLTAPLGSTSTLADWTGGLYYSELRNQTGSSGLQFPEGARPVRLAILDTAPTGTGAPPPPAPGASQHGFSIARIAGNLTCSAESPLTCVAAVKTRLALPRTSVGLEPPAGETHDGGFGSPGDLAEAIARETLAWDEDVNGRASGQNLILNLSLGWDPDELHAVAPPLPGEELNTEEAAVYSALVYAAQRGALVIAAAGNGNGGLRPGHGAVWPAAWYAAPPNLPGSMGSTPLIWAIGAVDRANRPLANARAGALPPFVTYADHAAVPLGGSQWTSPLTGTSVSAVVASSIAAFVWSQQPNLSAENVMSQLASSGEDIGRSAELFRQSGVQVRRLRFGAAQAGSLSAPFLSPTVASFTSNTVACTGTTFITIPSNCPGAGKQLRICPQSWAPTPSSPCPLPSAYISVNAVPWVLTQPGGDNCPTCTLSAGPPQGGITRNPRETDTSTQRNAAGGPAPQTTSDPPPNGWDLYLEIPDAWPDNDCPTSVLVEAEAPGTQTQSIWLQVSPGLCQNSSLIVTGLQLSADITSAAVSFLVNHGSSLERSPLYVVWRQ